MQEQLDLSPKRLIQDGAIRWNATFHILERLIELKVAIMWEASGNYATAGVIIPVVNSIMRSLEVFKSDIDAMKMKREMLRSLKECYRYMESNEYYAVATLLDPWFKQKVFSSSAAAALAKQMFTAAHEALEDEEEDCTPKFQRLGSNSSASNQKKSSQLWKHCDKLMDEKERLKIPQNLHTQ